MSNVTRQSGESVERLISRFRRKVIRKGVLRSTRSNRYFHKEPSRRMQKVRAIYREQKRKEYEKQAMGL